MAELERRLSTGAEVKKGGVHFRVYAPRRQRVAVLVEGREIALAREPDGHFSALAPGVRPGALYRFRLDDDDAVPDPTSRFQPDGPHGPSEVVDPSTFRWTDAEWRGLRGMRGQVLYELHLGTFTPEGTYAAAAKKLEHLRDLGVTAVELLPLAEFPGRFGWGYDGVDLYAPSRLYGRPDDLRAFVDRAHRLGVGVLLDVVYNHLGPSGNYLGAFVDHLFSSKYENEWGEPIDFETDPFVRRWFVENAGYWIDEMHLDGLRFDATQSVLDASPTHVLVEMGERARAAAGRRSILLVCENEPQEAKLVRPREAGGYGLDALWNDDFHHSAIVAATGRREAYYADTRGTPQELLSAVKWGYLFQGQLYAWQGKRRGAPALDVDPSRFVLYLENHDQVSNSGRGARLHQVASPAVARAMTTLLLLAPGTPMLFQGQEFASTPPFTFFADHDPELAALVRKGRQQFLDQFPSLASHDAHAMLPSPEDRLGFEACKLDWSESVANARVLAMHRELLRLRRIDPVFGAQRSDWLNGAVLAEEAFLLRFATGSGADRLVLLNLGRDLATTDVAEPLLAPPAGARWDLLFSSEDPRWGGDGTPAADRYGERVIRGRSALVLAPRPASEEA